MQAVTAQVEGMLLGASCPVLQRLAVQSLMGMAVGSVFNLGSKKLSAEPVCQINWLKGTNPVLAVAEQCKCSELT